MDLKYLKEILFYTPETGIWVWLKSRGSVRLGQEAGCIDKRDGYRWIGINGKIYKSSRLVWFYMTGEFPTLEVDHKDTNKANDKWVNLRLATKSQQKYNQQAHRDNKLGSKGIYYDRKRNKYLAQLAIDGRNRFNTFEEAKLIYERNVQEFIGEFGRVE